MVGAGLFGCAAGREADRDVANALKQYEQRRGQEADSYARMSGAPARDAPANDLTNDEAGPGSLRAYILLALEQNPDIKAAEEIARAKAARVSQVTALADPVLMAKVLPEPVRTAEGDNYFVLGIQQKFPVPEKLSRAGSIALHEARMALEDVQAVRLRVIADVKRAYFRLYVIDKTIEIDRANQGLLRGLIDAAQAQVATGRRSQGDVLRVQVEFSTLESKLIELRRDRETTVAMLNRLLNRSLVAAVPEPAGLSIRDVDVEIERLFEIAGRDNPELERLRLQTERDREAVKLAKLAYWPDFTVGIEWMKIDPRAAFQPLPNPQTGIRPPAPKMSEEGSDNWAIVFGLNIPLWLDKIEGGIREARSRLLASQHRLASAQNRVYFEVEEALARVRAQQELAELFGKTIIPQAQQAYEVSRAAYTSGGGDFLFVVDNWQKWLAFSIQYHRALGELERGVADLEQALGLSLGEVGGS